MAKLQIQNLTKKYGDNTVVNKMTLDVENGQLTTIVGPSGCGKTTILRMIAGFITPTGGRIDLDERTLVDIENGISEVTPENRNIGMVFQSYAVWPHMNVFDNVGYPLKIRKTDKRVLEAEVNRVLRVVHLEGLEKRMAHELSGGQQQRVALARALILKPKLLLLDEPLSNLDAALREEMRGEIKEIQMNQGITIINVTHDQIEAMTMSDKVAVIRDGILEQYASPKELYEYPINRFVAQFIGTANILPATKEAGQEPDENNMMTIRVCDRYTMKVPFKDSDQTEGYAAVRAQHIEDEAGSGLKAIVRRNLYQGSQIEYYLQVDGCEEEDLIRMLMEVDFEKPEGSVIEIGIEKAVWLDD
ncbi:ABC transporter ATP-binding protein [Alkalibacter rhizosphaerae]|uniref:ABC transporter ATP-binding protein n=1 Tax=Alkalibacter rhizosphaerae TaxID=2815577 RepID=A0A975AIH7_9FIRM|nr:ABC transporter ATP-binding protein [Alkalibacter rhizosphaerae]QSX08694.1 ABC transporter ATP-binding protein [Alkalibacter rhizosphaerae]